MRTYLINYPYTLTIVLLSVIVMFGYISSYAKINHYKFKCGLFFTSLYGICQIHGMENVPNVAAWSFPKGSALFNDLGLSIGKIVPEDIIFVVVFYSIFYFFMFLTRNVKDYLQDKNFLKMSLVALMIIIEAALYQSAGLGCRILIVSYTIPTVSILIIYLVISKKSINATHMLLMLFFAVFVNCGWDLINAYLQHWVYNEDCELFSKNGWFLNGKLHTTIHFQYAITGFFVMYASWIGFDKWPQRYKN